MQALLATIAAAAWLFLSGALVFAAWLPRWWAEHFGAIIRDPKSLPIWAVGLEKLAQGLGLTLLVEWTSRSAAQIVAIPLLLVSATYLLSTYANYRVEGRAVSVVAIIDAIRVIGGVAIVSVILGRAFA